jgi:hypothetical protein
VIVLLFSAALAAAPAQTQTGAGLTPREMGRASVIAGMCSTIGWESSRERAMALGQAYVVENGLDDAATAAEVEVGVQEAAAEVEAVVQALDQTGDVEAFKTALRTRCDETARRLPALMNRTEQTDAVFDARIIELLTGQGD